jgi:putative hydrolase of the HAD superfamily
MRMPEQPGIRAVLFDYGRTLVTFEYPAAELKQVVERFRPAIAAATGRPAPDAEEIVRSVLLPLEDVIENPDEDEVGYIDIYTDAWRRAGLHLPEALIYEILDAEQQVWDRAAVPVPDGMEILEWLGAHGIRRGICSNAPFPPEMMQRQVRTNGIGAVVDAVVFSSQVGRRKPAPEVYRAALDAVSAEADESLFVGDRVREDYEGPRAVGMRAVVCTAYAAEPPPDGIPTIASLLELRRLL